MINDEALHSDSSNWVEMDLWFDGEPLSLAYPNRLSGYYCQISSKTEMNYSNSRIIRRCGQLGIPYPEVIESPYFKSQGLSKPALRIQYRDGVLNKIGWGHKKRSIDAKSTTPHCLSEMQDLLASEFDPSSE